jgi:hypothetical protein
LEGRGLWRQAAARAAATSDGNSSVTADGQDGQLAIDAWAWTRYRWRVLLPFDRDKLRMRNRADAIDARTEASTSTPEDGLEAALELGEVVRELARATVGEQLAVDDLAEKSRLYVLPLRLAQRS